jgi:CBS domain-containing protein
MTSEPVTIPADAPLTEAIQLLVDRHISAAPVVDRGGRAIGVVSRTDIVEHDRETVNFAREVPEYFNRRDLTLAAGEELPAGFQVEAVDRTRVREVMTPAVFAVRPEAPVEEVVRQIVTLNVHRLFVVDSSGVLVGVITTMDIIRNLQP